MAEIGSVTTRVGSLSDTVINIPVDENVGGILFDISGFDSPFENHLQLKENFGSNQVQLINNLDEANTLGLMDETFLNGLVYYHLSMFYSYVNDNMPLYIAFADCSSNWDFVHIMQRSCNGRMFQLGVWTHQPLWEINPVTGLIVLSSLALDIETAVEELSGKVGQPSGSPMPLSVVLSANTQINSRNFNLKMLPDGTMYDAPKVSVLLCQNGTDATHELQSKMPDTAPVGCIGLAMAIMSLAGAEENIGSVKDYNLNKNEDFQFPEIVVNGTYYPLDKVNKIIQSILTSYGYIIPTTYPAREGECYFGGDPTLSRGDYNIISNNRVIHKCRRAIFSVLFPYLHSNQLYESASKSLSNSVLQMFEEAIGSALSGKLINRGGNYQIDGYRVNSFDTENILNDDVVSIQYTVSPVNYNGTLTETVYAL